MSSNLPEDFFSWKSFQSLTQTAALAWILILITDAIFIMGIKDEYRQLIFIWTAGFGICFFLSCVRLYYKEVKEKGDYLLVIFNAALIFLYASGFSGFTKELGNWSKVKDTMSEQAGVPEGKAAFSYQLASFVPDIFSRQTAFYPDVKRIEENHFLAKENKNLAEKNQQAENKINLLAMGDNSHARIIDSLVNANALLRKKVAVLDSAAGKSASSSDDIAKLKQENSSLYDTISRLKMDLNKCQSKTNQPSKEAELQDLINQHNNLVDAFNQCASNSDYKGQLDKLLNSKVPVFSACNAKARQLLYNKIGK